MVSSSKCQAASVTWSACTRAEAQRCRCRRRGAHLRRRRSAAGRWRAFQAQRTERRRPVRRHTQARLPRRAQPGRLQGRYPPSSRSAVPEEARCRKPARSHMHTSTLASRQAACLSFPSSALVHFLPSRVPPCPPTQTPGPQPTRHTARPMGQCPASNALWSPIKQSSNRHPPPAPSPPGPAPPPCCHLRRHAHDPPATGGRGWRSRTSRRAACGHA